jgi:serine protease
VASNFTLRSRLLAATIACAFAIPAAARPGDEGYNRFIVKFKPQSVESHSASARQRALDNAGLGHGVHLGLQRHLAVGADLVISDKKLDHTAAKALLARLARDPSVAYVDFDRRVHHTMTPNDPSYASQWHYFDATSSIRADTAWDTATGNGIVVAVIDTGITNHADLNANVIAGYDFISDTATANDGGGRDADPSDPGDWVIANECYSGSSASNSSWHGTHVAGTVAAVTNNNLGVAGVAFNAKVQPLRVLGKCGGWTSDIADAIVWASGGSVPGVPANATPAEVINMTLGGSGSCDPLSQDAINIAVANGTTVVVAAGNESDAVANHSPASCNNVITVGAVGKTGNKASYSNYGPLVDVSAPGGALSNSVYSTVNTGTTVPVAAGYAGYQGTSMATPHVAGVVAMLQSIQVNTPALVETIIKGTTRAMGTCSTGGCGTGLVDAPNALAALNNAFVYIDDPAVTLEGNSGTKTLTFTVRLSKAVAGAVTFNIATANGTATAGTDYVANSVVGESIAAGMLSKTFSVTINGDATTEADETVLVNLTNVVGANVLDSQAVGTIVNDEAIALTNNVALTNQTAALNATTLYKLDVPAGATNLQFQTSGGSAGQDADIYVAANMSPTQHVDCSSAGTTTVELCSIPSPVAGTYYLQVVAYTAYSGVTVLGSYTPPSGGPSLSINDVSVTEGNSGTKSATFTVSLSAVSGSPVTFDIATASGSATSGSDFQALALTNQSIPAGQTSKTFNVTINGDTTVEANETYLVNLSNASSSVTDGQGQGTIQNDDVPVLSINDTSIAEGDAGTKVMTFTVSLNQAGNTAVTYDIATANGTALSGSDYVAKALVGESIAAGMTSKTFTVTINGDIAIEPNENLAVNVTNVSGATIGDGRGVGTIQNDEVPRLIVNDVSVTEGDVGTKLMTFTISLTQAAGVDVTYDIATANGYALAPYDYTAGSALGETIPAGQLSKTYSVVIKGDTVMEGDETLAVNLSNASGAVILDGRGVGTILNDDKPKMTITDVSVEEGNSDTSLMTFTVQLSQASQNAITYDIATSNGYALAGSDYDATTLIGESIPAGMTSKTFTVAIHGDTTVEGNETLAANISNVSSGATLADGRGVGTILNDD